MSRKNKEERQVPKNFDEVLSLEECGYIFSIPTNTLKFKPKPITLKVKWTRRTEQIINENFKKFFGVKI